MDSRIPTERAFGQPPATRFAPAKKALFRGSALVVSVLIGVALLEIGLRLAPFFLPEPARSFVEEAARFRLSNVRMYPREVAIRLPSDEKADILVVGDSFPFGTYEASEDVYATRIGELLGKKVVNLGVGSTSPPTYNRMIEVGARYHPRVVVYAVFANDFLTEDDFEPRRLALENTFRSLDRDRFFISYDTTGRVQSAVRTLTNHFLSYQLFKSFRPLPATFAVLPWWHGEHFFLFPERSYWEVLVAWENESVRRGTETNHELIKEARRFSRDALGAKFLVVMQPSKEMVYGPLTGELRSKVYSESWDRTYEELNKRLRRSGIPVLDLTNDLRERARAGAKLYHSIDGHFNQQGHRVVAEILSQALSPMLTR